MKLVLKVTGFLVLFILALATLGALLPTGAKYSYSGNVSEFDTGNPIDGVEITLFFDSGTIERGITSLGGTFRVDSYNVGLKKISAKKIGYLFSYKRDSLFIRNSLDFTGWKPDHSSMIESSDNILFTETSELGVNISLGDIILNASSSQSGPDWKLNLSLDQGELIEAIDSQIMFAPLIGYSNEIIFKSSESEPKGASKWLYFRTNKPEKKYGWIRVRFKPFSSGGPILYLIDWGINTTGKQDLRHQSDGYRNLLLKSKLVWGDE